MFNSLSTVLDPKKSKAKYPEARVIDLDESIKTLEEKYGVETFFNTEIENIYKDQDKVILSDKDMKLK